MDETLIRRMMHEARKRYRKRAVSSRVLPSKKRHEWFSQMLSDVVATFGVPRGTDEHNEYKSELGRRLHKLAVPALKRAQEERQHHKREAEKESRALFTKLDAALAEFVGTDTIAALNADEMAQKARRRSRSRA